MKVVRLTFVSLFMLLHVLASESTGASERREHISENLFQAVNRIRGPGSQGTVFYIACEAADSGWYYPVMVTARHVLDSIRSDTATVLFRRLVDDTLYEVIPHQIVIRENGVPMYFVHPNDSVDLAVMKHSFPRFVKESFQPIFRSFLASEDDFTKFLIHPGDAVYFIGYPLGYSGSKGDFPILRSGAIASYPLLPLLSTPMIHLDGQVYGGNSGGPVFIEYDLHKWNDRAINVNIKILGVMTASVIFERTNREQRTTRQSLFLGGS